MNNREFKERFRILSKITFGKIVICHAGVFDLV